MPRSSNAGKICPKHGLEYVQKKCGKNAMGLQKYQWRCPGCQRDHERIRYHGNKPDAHIRGSYQRQPEESYLEQGLITEWGMRYARGRL